MRRLGKHSSLLRSWRKLTSPKERKKQGLFLGEGIGFLEQSLLKPEQIEAVLFQESVKDRFSFLCQGIEKLFSLEDGEFFKLAPSVHSRGVLVVCKKGELGHFQESFLPSLIVVAQGMQDPGNLGGVLRSAWGHGDCGVLVVGGVDPLNDKVVRSSAGAILQRHWEVCEGGQEAQDLLRKKGYPIYGAENSPGATDLNDFSWPSKTALWMGQEAHGLDEKLRKDFNGFLRIALHPECDSLNVGVSAALMMFHQGWSKK